LNALTARGQGDGISERDKPMIAVVYLEDSVVIKDISR
jgi:hypothetical protein